MCSYKTHFAKYIEKEVDAEAMEDTWKEVYEKIRKDPVPPLSFSSLSFFLMLFLCFLN